MNTNITKAIAYIFITSTKEMLFAFRYLISLRRKNIPKPVSAMEIRVLQGVNEQWATYPKILSFCDPNPTTFAGSIVITDENKFPIIIVIISVV